MNIIKDTSQRLNLSPMDIYFIVKEGESPQVVKFLELLNNNHSLTQGIFKFHLVVADKDEYPYINEISGENNLILRLIENLGDNHEYIVHQSLFRRRRHQKDHDHQLPPAGGQEFHQHESDALLR